MIQTGSTTLREVVLTVILWEIPAVPWWLLVIVRRSETAVLQKHEDEYQERALPFFC